MAELIPCWLSFVSKKQKYYETYIEPERYYNSSFGATYSWSPLQSFERSESDRKVSVRFAGRSNPNWLMQSPLTAAQNLDHNRISTPALHRGRNVWLEVGYGWTYGHRWHVVSCFHSRTPFCRRVATCHSKKSGMPTWDHGSMAGCLPWAQAKKVIKRPFKTILLRIFISLFVLIGKAGLIVSWTNRTKYIEDGDYKKFLQPMLQVY
jgi:hypothetical protein